MKYESEQHLDTDVFLLTKAEFGQEFWEKGTVLPKAELQFGGGVLAKAEIQLGFRV